MAPASSRPGRLSLGRSVAWWRRSPRRTARLVAASGLALIAAGFVAGRTDQATRAAAGWGHGRAVVVARHDLAPGRVLGGDDITRRTLPDAAVPEQAATDDPTGRTVTQPIEAGEVVSTARLAPAGAQGVAALVPADRRAVAVPIEGTGVRVRVGDHVDVFAPDCSGGATLRTSRTAAGAVVHDATVIDVGDAAVTLAVPGDEVAALADALGEGTPVLALIGPSG